MPEQGEVVLSLVDGAGRPIHDPETIFAFRRASDGLPVGGAAR
ncbi:MAG: hypothetical protein ACRD96_27745 [Bryobacteraceae bacterium]